jgi:competence protein ComEA
MLLSEAQRLGALAVLVASLTVYGISLFCSRQPLREIPLSWGNQGPGLMAVEFEGDPAKEGIYFLPKGATFETIRGIVEIPGMNNREEMDNVRISDGSALLISHQEEVTIGEMAASKKLALGLPIDLNLASGADLALVPGIGEKMAIQIIQLRERRGEFRDLSELTAVPGIKEKKLDVLRGYLKVIAPP